MEKNDLNRKFHLCAILLILFSSVFQTEKPKNPRWIQIYVRLVDGKVTCLIYLFCKVCLQECSECEAAQVKVVPANPLSSSFNWFIKRLSTEITEFHCRKCPSGLAWSGQVDFPLYALELPGIRTVLSLVDQHRRADSQELLLLTLLGVPHQNCFFFGSGVRWDKLYMNMFFL